MSQSIEAKVARFLSDHNVKDAARIIFRMEDSDGRGVYQSSYLSEAKDPHGYGGASHRPAPSRDGLRNFNWGHHFGFGDTTQVRNWFNQSQRKALREVGVDVYVYETRAPKTGVKRGNKQLVFDKSKAKKLGTIIL